MAARQKPQSRRAEAERLVAEDRLSDEAIAARVGIDPATLWRWKQEQPFTDRVAAIVTAAREQAMTEAIAHKGERMRILAELVRRDLQIIEERAADPAMEDVPGGSSGLLVRHYKSIGSGDSAEKVEEFEADTPLQAEVRNTLKQAAVEMGQWSEKHELTGKDGKDLPALVTVYIPENHRDASSSSNSRDDQAPGGATGEVPL